MPCFAGGSHVAQSSSALACTQAPGAFQNTTGTEQPWTPAVSSYHPHWVTATAPSQPSHGDLFFPEKPSRLTRFFYKSLWKVLFARKCLTSSPPEIRAKLPQDKLTSMSETNTHLFNGSHRQSGQEDSRAIKTSRADCKHRKLLPRDSPNLLMCRMQAVQLAADQNNHPFPFPSPSSTKQFNNVVTAITFTLRCR